MFTNSFALDSFSVIPNRRISQAQNASSRAQHASEIQTPKVSWNWIITSFDTNIIMHKFLQMELNPI